MRKSNTLIWLLALIILLAGIAAGAGLFWRDSGSPFAFTTLHGATAQIHGAGIYHFDTVFFAGSFIGTDAVTLFLGIPLLILFALLHRRGSLRGGLLLLGLLTYFVYYGASMAFGVAYNILFLVYTALFSASLFAFVHTFLLIDLPALPAQISARMPHRAIAAFMFVSGVVLLLVWMSDLGSAIAQGQPPTLLASYTTMVTYVLDLGLIVPALLVTGSLLVRRAPLGYPLACSLLVLCVLIGVAIISQTVVQQQLGIVLAPAVMAIFIGSFVLMSLFATWMLVLLLRHITDRAAPFTPFPSGKGWG